MDDECGEWGCLAAIAGMVILILIGTWVLGVWVSDGLR